MINKESIKSNIFLAILLAIVMPIIIGQLLNKFVPITFISIPIHSSIESAGGIIAIVISMIFYMKYRNTSFLTHFNWATTALLAMGIMDIFHASVAPGKMFVWLHSIAVFFGGLLFISVWFKERAISKKLYTIIPILFIIFPIVVSSLSIIFSEYVPQMINPDKTFTTTANILNVVGGIGFFIASVKFVIIYIGSEEIEDILFAGHAMLFGIAGILFVSSVVWDMQWWLWHVLRLSAYGIAFYFLYTEYQKEMEEVETANNILNATTKELGDNAAFFESFKKATDEGNLVSKSDISGNITYVNKNFCKVTGYTEDEVIGKPHSIVKNPDTDTKIFKDLWDTIKSQNTWKGTLKNRRKDGTDYWVDITISPILNDEGETVEYVAIRHDITELVKQREELEISFQTDTLTGIGNRLKLINDIKEVKSASLVLINIDNFREINDFYGHKFGDLVISELANRISSTVKTKKLYRIQGDEFAILNNESDRDTCVGKMHSVVNSITVKDFIVQDEEISIQVTTVISFENEKNNLFTTADMAMKVARREHKSFLVYDESTALDKEYENNIKWTKKLKSAIKDDRIVPFYQAIVNNHTGEYEKYEALVRMIDKDEKIISPYFFLDIAKRTKNYIHLTQIMISKSFETFKDMDVEFSVNLTIQDIMDDSLKEFLFQKLDEYKIGKKVVFEIVESEGIENFDKVLEFIKNVKEFGCRIAIDDFGTGYSNFEYLLQLKADYIKIDGSMIKDIDKDSDARVVVSTIVDFAKKMDIKTIAEFVKDDKIQSIVKDMGIDYSQGFYFSEPRQIPEIKKLKEVSK